MGEVLRVPFATNVFPSRVCWRFWRRGSGWKYPEMYQTIFLFESKEQKLFVVALLSFNLASCNVDSDSYKLNSLSSVDSAYNLLFR